MSLPIDVPVNRFSEVSEGNTPFMDAHESSFTRETPRYSASLETQWSGPDEIENMLLEKKNQGAQGVVGIVKELDTMKKENSIMRQQIEELKGLLKPKEEKKEYKIICSFCCLNSCRENNKEVIHKNKNIIHRYMNEELFSFIDKLPKSNQLPEQYKECRYKYNCSFIKESPNKYSFYFNKKAERCDIYNHENCV